MREYDDDYNDDSIRLYTPILQRVVILAAVIIAVPVLMWTITTFVRNYVARPRVPALEHVASTTPSTRLPLAAAPAAPPAPDQSPAPQSDIGSASDTANAAAGIKQATNSPAIQAAPVPAVSQASAAATGDPSQASVPSALPGSLSKPAQAQPQAPRPSDALSAGANTDRGIAWPNPNATNPPDFAAPRLASPAPPPARTATTEELPAGEPVRGPVPLPRHRPGILAMAATVTGSVAGTVTRTMAGSVTGTIAGPAAAGGHVPLPRSRPNDAPAEAANSVIEPAYGYRPGLDADR